MKIKKITIMSTSGYCPVEEAYHDKVIITESSISYEYEPEFDLSQTNIPRKWSYKTDSPIFRKLFEQVCELSDTVIHMEITDIWRDMGELKFQFSFDDGTIEKRKISCIGDAFPELFHVIRQMVPSTEYMPAALLMDEDFYRDE